MTIAAPHGSLPVIALVSSAGGLEATSDVLRALPKSFRGAVIVLQHVSPTHGSHLAAILGRRTELTVRDAADGDRLQAGLALVVPPGRHALVGPDRCVRLVRTDSFPPPRPSADILLCTLATAVGPDAVAVVLSGNGHDGAIGVQAIDAYGGRVFVQDAATALHPSMPASAFAADHAEPALGSTEIGPRLLGLVGDGVGEGVGRAPVPNPD